MATASSARPVTSVGTDRREGHGWVLYAGTMLCIVGVLNFIYGIAAVGNSKFYIRNVEYVISDLKLWGWFLVILGAIQFLAAFSIWSGTQWGRWVGIGSAGTNAVVQLMAVPGAPFLCLALLAMDLLILYGLITYGGRPQTA